MSSRARTLFLLVCCFLLLSGPSGRGAVKCDNDCRMRFDHYSASTGTCLQFSQSSCAFCSPGSTNRCYPRVGELGGDCGEAGSLVVYRYQSCTTVCPPGTNNVVEAKDVGGELLEVNAGWRYVCTPVTSLAR